MALPFLFPLTFLALSPTERTLVILQKRVAGLKKAALREFVARARKLVGLRGSVNVLVTGSAELRALNRRFRGKAKATDVLSFPSFEVNLHGHGDECAGDIAISAEIAAENAARFSHSASAEIKILTLHGILHLAGFDHERDNGSMARKETQLRRRLKLPSALIERVQSGASDRATTKRKRHRAGAAKA